MYLFLFQQRRLYRAFRVFDEQDYKPDDETQRNHGQAEIEVVEHIDWFRREERLMQLGIFKNRITEPHIATMEAGLKKLETREQKYSVELDKALTEYAELKAQTADFDPVELYAARQAIRPTQEKAAERQLKDSNSMQEKPSLVMLLNAKQESSRLLGEDAEERQVRQMTMRRRSTEQLKRSQLKKDRRKIER